MSAEELIRLIKVWLKNVRDGHLTTDAFTTVVESLINLYSKDQGD